MAYSVQFLRRFAVFLLATQLTILVPYSILVRAESLNMESVMRGEHRIYDVGKITSIRDTLLDTIVNQEQRVLLVLDIDDTLIRPAIDMGTDPWFSYALQDSHIHDVRTQLQLLYSLLTFNPIEKETEDFVDAIKILKDKYDQQFRYMCMTSRHVTFHSNTIIHLKDASFANVLVQHNMLSIDNPTHFVLDPEDSTTPKVRYIDNICFCSGGSKGDTLVKMLENYRNKNNGILDFDLVIFVDDSLKNVKDVSSKLKNYTEKFRNTTDSPATISSISIHYTYMEEHKNRYSIHHFTDDKTKIHKMFEFKKYINTKTKKDSE